MPLFFCFLYYYYYFLFVICLIELIERRSANVSLRVRAFNEEQQLYFFHPVFFSQVESSHSTRLLAALEDHPIDQCSNRDGLTIRSATQSCLLETETTKLFQVCIRRTSKWSEAFLQPDNTRFCIFLSLRKRRNLTDVEGVTKKTSFSCTSSSAREQVPRIWDLKTSLTHKTKRKNKEQKGTRKKKKKNNPLRAHHSKERAKAETSARERKLFDEQTQPRFHLFLSLRKRRNLTSAAIEQKTSFSEHILVHFTSSHKNKHDKNEQNTSEICPHTQVPTKEKKQKK